MIVKKKIRQVVIVVVVGVLLPIPHLASKRVQPYLVNVIIVVEFYFKFN